MSNVPFFIALAAGFLSFLSPCVLPLLPSYLSFITGVSLEELIQRGKDSRMRKITIINSLIFIFGFSLVFVLLGTSVSLVGNILFRYQIWITRIGGIFIIIFGLHLTGVLNLSLLQRDKRIHLGRRPLGYLGSFLAGIVFAAGWSPCIGPILGAILFYAASQNSILLGISLLAVYSLGLAIPFFLSSLALQIFLEYYAKLRKHLRLVSLISGGLLIAVGVLLATNNFALLSLGLNRWLSF
ncbi:cytochrome c biogenesis protein CcdA [Candidatus Aerophobetes bacterium]|uniref:Cytochrome c biogenesis protein CcdA n=1 Tax=Aerophobetes bacterium TaxID=2030807 RepID=A0A523QJZ8_UNCAE|nr:MAG: cytochrome c biogenesis protein CcdA [Candidatus Aerophobetes bacterium]